jgi:alpha-beta hydrolase superfamily lysophospholipase
MVAKMLKNPAPPPELIQNGSFSYSSLLEQIRLEISPNPATTHQSTGWYSSSEGLQIFYRIWKSAHNPPKGVILCLHGMGGDGEYYVLLADQLIAAGYTIVVYDHVGHGFSEGPRGDIRDFSLHFRIAAEMLRWVGSEFPNIPIFALGESMGGTVLINTLIDSNHLPSLRGILLFAPGVKVKKNVASPKLVLKMIPPLLISPFCPGRLSFEIRAQPSDNIRNGLPIMHPLHFEYDLTHPYHWSHVSGRFLWQINKAFNRALIQGPALIGVPLILFYGTNDLGIDRAGVVSFFERVSCPHKEFVEVEGAPHAMFTHPTFQPYWKKIIAWLNQRS